MPTRGARRKAAKQRQGNLARQYEPEYELSDPDVMNMEDSINQTMDGRKHKGLTRSLPFNNPILE